MAAGCAQAPEQSYVSHYESALAATGASEGRASLQPFFDLFTDLTASDVEQKVLDAYADDMYFNDTLHTYTRVEDLAAYLVRTANQLDSISVTIQDHWQSGEDVYVRWSMDTAFTVAGKQRQVSSIGITHLRFDQQGKVVLHQDYWDSTEGFYRHLPVSGQAINWIRKRM